MPRSIWKGAISFGLVTIPVKLFSATEEKDISFRQVHPEDGGRIKYKRVCEKCGKEIPYTEIAKGYELPDGRMVILAAEDFEALPLATTKAVEVVQFVDEDEVDPTYFNKTYFLQADGPGVKPYVLLRDALTKSGQSAVVKVALRSREALALIRPKDGVLLMHTMLWPDELRDGSFAAPPENVMVSDAEVTMAQSFISALAGDFKPEDFTDSYREALETLVHSKADGVPLAEEPEAPAGGRGGRPGRRAAGLGRGRQEAARGGRAGQGDVTVRAGVRSGVASAQVDAVTQVPPPANEPVLSYAPGSAERATLEERLKELAAADPVELTATIGDQTRMAGGRRSTSRCRPTTRHVLGRANAATAGGRRRGHRGGPAGGARTGRR